METHWEANKKEEKGKQTRKEKKFRRRIAAVQRYERFRSGQVGGRGQVRRGRGQALV